MALDSLKHENIKTLKQNEDKRLNYKENLRGKMNKYVNFVYDVTMCFPKHELYGSGQQWRRAALSIILNYIEGYARKKPAVQLNFMEISYGSFKESKYLIYFAQQREYITESSYKLGMELMNEIGAMLWTEITGLKKSIEGKLK